MSERTDRYDIGLDDFHVCGPGLDPYVEPRCPHPWHEQNEKARALRSHRWESFLAPLQGYERVESVEAMCNDCGQDFRRVYFYDADDMWCPEES